MLLEKIAIFIIFLGPLVFFHELGHFLFARLAGVRVEVFSIGFGPKLFKKMWKGTEYTVSAIPLGGYVKMFGDDPLKAEELTEEEKKVAFTHKTKWQRFWIVFGGPLANFILAFFIYFALVSVGETVPQARFGVIDKGTKYYDLGFRTGDALKSINGKPVLSFDDLNLIDSEVETITVERSGVEKKLNIKIDGFTFVKEFSSYRNQLRAPIVIGKDQKKYFVSTSNDLKNVDYYQSIQQIFIAEPEKLYLYPVEGEISSLKKIEDINLKPQSTILEIESDARKEIFEAGYYTVDLMVDKVSGSSAAEKAGVQANDVILSLDGQKLYDFDELKNNVQKSNKDQVRELQVLRNGEVKTLEITPGYIENNGKYTYLLGVVSNVMFIPMKMVESQAEGFFDAIATSLYRTKEGMIKTFLGYKKLFTLEVPLKNIGGPVAIGQVAAESFSIGFSMFFRLMAIISLNLGIINLFPIPVLDGGHIVFIFLELLNGGPLSRKKIQIAQQFGLSLLFLLIFVALFNDFSRILS
jgi:regulator of sigma E protease